LSSRFPDFPETPEMVRDAAPISIASISEVYAGEVLLESVGGVARIHLGTSKTFDSAALVDPHRLAVAEQALDNLRVAIDSVPYPIWQEKPQTGMNWYNAAYGFETACVQGCARRTQSPCSISRNASRSMANTCAYRFLWTAAIASCDTRSGTMSSRSRMTTDRP